MEEINERSELLLRYEFKCDPEFKNFEEKMTIRDGYLELFED